MVALGYQSPICYNILLPVLQKGIDINSPDELNLLEDSMLVSLTSFVFIILSADIIHFCNKLQKGHFRRPRDKKSQVNFFLDF